MLCTLNCANFKCILQVLKRNDFIVFSTNDVDNIPMYLIINYFYFIICPMILKNKNVSSSPRKLKTALLSSTPTPENFLELLSCMNASSFIMVQCMYTCETTKHGSRRQKKKNSEMPQDWKELADLYFDMFDEHGFEWFPEGTSAVDKQHISTMMIDQATTICIRVTNAYH